MKLHTKTIIRKYLTIIYISSEEKVPLYTERKESETKGSNLVVHRVTIQSLFYTIKFTSKTVPVNSHFSTTYYYIRLKRNYPG